MPQLHHESSKSLYHRFRLAYQQRRLKNLSRYPKQDDRDPPRGNKAERRGHLRRYVSWLWRYWPTVILLIFLSLATAAIEMTHPLFMRTILDHVLLAESMTNAEKLQRLHMIGALFLVVILAGQLMDVFKNYRTRQLNVRVVLSLRRAIYDRMLHLGLDRLTSLKTGGIITRLTGDVNMTTGLLQMGLISPGVSLVRLLIALSMLLYLNWRLALFGVTILPLVILVSYIIARRVRPIYRSIRDDAAHVDGRVGETFGGIRIVRGFQRETTEKLGYLIGRHSIVRKQLFAHRRELALWTAWGFLLASINLVALWYGGTLYVRGIASIGDLMAFQWYAMLLLNPVWSIVNTISELQRSLAAMERVFEVLEMPVDKPDKEDAIDAPRVVEQVQFDDVSFEYVEGIPVLHQIDATIPGGSTVALVGRSGAGKTTITDLVARFYDPTSGRLLVNGVDVRDFRLASYRRLLGLVQQDTFLFDGTVRENIAYGRPEASESEILSAARRANADEFIVNLEQGYDSVIGERGVRLSGGQSQRLAIARAILADPQILILDEATSNLDSESEQLIQESLDKLLQGRTTFVIAHRLSTVTDADLILVLDEGRIVEQGTHHELLARGGLYCEMIERQQESMQC